MEDETMKKCKYCGIEFVGAYDFCSDYCRDTYITNHRTGKLSNTENINKIKGKAPFANYDSIAKITSEGMQKGMSYGKMVAENQL